MKPGATFERVLVVGDPHLKVSRLEDSREFAAKLVEEVRLGLYTKVIILGDLFDTFAIIRAEILAIWIDALTAISGLVGKDGLILLVGNHDYAGLRGGSHALAAFRHLAQVVDQLSIATVGGGEFFFLPFMRSNEAFEEAARAIPAGSILFCHQSFNGAKFENGFYDPHGADPECVSHLKRVISGHIHTCQAVGDIIWYPGTPFQQSFGEAGQKKAVFHLNMGQDADGPFATMQKARPLGMPEFVLVKADTVAGIELPEPDPRTSYKVVATGTPQEIAEFWRGERAVAFRAGARRVVDAMVPKRDVETAEVEGESTEDRLVSFISTRNWRVPWEALIDRAKKFLAD